MVSLTKKDDTIKVTEYQLCGRKYIRQGQISQMTEIKAKAVRRREGIIGYNVYIFFNQDKPIVFHCRNELTLSRNLDEISQYCLQKNATLDDGTCCSTDWKCICPPNFKKVYAILISLAIVYIATTIVLFYKMDKEIESIEK